jgi:PST family polysaccharide transporter
MGTLSKNLFDTENLRNDMRRKSFQGGLSVMTAEIISSILRLASTVVLARLLMPEHFGLISMVTALTIFAERFKDLGLDIATIQKKKITHEQVSNLFWINFGVGVLLMLLFSAASPAISWFYKEDRLILITLALSTSFFFSGLTIQHQAILRRQMLFPILAIVQTISVGLSFIVGIFLAWKGYGYWALVWKEVARSVINTVGIWTMCRWLPSLPKRDVGVADMVRIGKDIMGFNIIHFFSQNLDKILIGKFLGAGPLGFYRQAGQLMSAPINLLLYPINSIALPALSALQDDPERYRQFYNKIVSVLAFVSMPLVLYISLFSENLIRLLLGEKWMESAAILSIFAIAAYIQIVGGTCGFVMITSGKTRRYFWWGVINSACVVVSFIIGIRWGLIGVAAAYAIANYTIYIFSLWFCFRNTPVSINLFLKAIRLPAISSLIMGLLLIIFKQQTRFMSNLEELIVTLCVAFISYSVIWLIMPEGRKNIIKYTLYSFSKLKPKRSHHPK